MSSWRDPNGDVVAGSVGPKIATVGTPNAVVICIGPVSFVINSRHCLINAISRRTVVRPDSTTVGAAIRLDRKSTRLNSSHLVISYAVFCLKKKKKKTTYNNSKKRKIMRNII